MTTQVELDSIQTVSLEFLRPGPSHGQLLSPLTPYIALCGEEGPITLRIEIEHWKLLNSLERLRYVSLARDGKRVESIPDGIRQSEVLELGEEVGRIFGSIPTLSSELGRAAGRLGKSVENEDGFVHLRLITSGSELSLLPFELMTSPKGFPGDGVAMMLQPRLPIVITREVRRGRPRSMDWGRKPRILFVSAAPENMYVPQRAHLLAIRTALDPWIFWRSGVIGKKPLEHVKKQITVLPNASIEDIERACATTDYTHVHILAHGDSYLEAGQRRYGIALHDDIDRNRKRVVDGARIAEALLASRQDSTTRSRPLFVSLATCDSGNVGSVAVPGGSIAHDLHSNGIPWVLASQFPLTMVGSVRMVELVYTGLLLGEDPRKLLRRLRASLHVAGQIDHDWASVVAYASFPDDLAEQVYKFRSSQMRSAIETELDRADISKQAGEKALLKAAIEQTRLWIDRWKKAIPTGEGPVERNLRAECYGVSGASEKRAAELHREDDMALDVNAPAAKKLMSVQLLEDARDSYRDAMGEGLAQLQHWPATQYLSLTAVLTKQPDRDRWYGTVSWAWDDTRAKDVETVAWAHGTLAELEMLKLYHDPDGAGDPGKVKDKVVRHCENIVAMMGSDSFHVFSTRRQFERYADWWRNDLWDEVVIAAVNALPSTWNS